MIFVFRLVVACLFFALSSCVMHPRTANYHHPLLDSVTIQTEAVLCAAQLGGGSYRKAELDSADIELINWNIQKGGDVTWTADLEKISSTPDLITLQEFSLHHKDLQIITDQKFHSFAPGYESATSTTGVMTISSAEPLTQCNLVSIEPWLRTPKATIITEYGLTASDERLLVINIHAVLFGIGTQIFEEQLLQITTIMDGHVGPILLSGDFNTWRGRRTEILKVFADKQNLQAVSFQEDYRKRAFGELLDYIYIRDLNVIEATTYQISSSDHNPMSVRLRL